MKLAFLDPTHQEGVNSTVRLGVRTGTPGEEVHIYRTEEPEKILYKAELLTIYIMRWHDLVDWPHMITQQHAESTRTLDGLTAALERAYGDKFNPEDDPAITMFFYNIQMDT